MIALASLPFEAWNRRHTRDTAERRAARAAVAHLKPATLIIGASRGIGLALAKTFSRRGHNIVLVARNEADLAAAVASLAPMDCQYVTSFACDVTDAAAFDTINDFLRASGYYIDCLVNNAGIGLSGPFETATTEKLHALLALNVTALAHFTQRAMRDMLAREQGAILNVASLGGVVPGPHQALYYASKSFVLSLTEALASEASGRGVRIAALTPGPVDTTFHAAMNADRAAYRALLPALSAEQVANRGYVRFMIGQRVIVPGLLYSAMYLAMRVTPHPFASAVTALLLKNPAR